MILRHTFAPPNNTRLGHLCGPLDAHLRRVEEALAVKVSHRNEQFKVEGPKVNAERAMEVLQALYEIAQRPIDAAVVQLTLAGDGSLRESDDGAVMLARQLMQRHGVAVAAQTVVFALALAMQDWR